MSLSGPVIAAFVIIHLLHFTTGTVHPQFQESDVYANLMTGFRVPAAAALYVLAMIFLALHRFCSVTCGGSG